MSGNAVRREEDTPNPQDGGGWMYLWKTLHKRGHRPDLGQTEILPGFKGSSTSMARRRGVGAHSGLQPSISVT
jgi:hypothetical protein